MARHLLSQRGKHRMAVAIAATGNRQQALAIVVNAASRASGACRHKSARSSALRAK